MRDEFLWPQQTHTHFLCNIGSRKESPHRLETWAPCKDSAFEFHLPTSEFQVSITGIASSAGSPDFSCEPKEYALPAEWLYAVIKRDVAELYLRLD